ncbi:MAG: class I SAM-dependent methyltransferase [Fulvivirga sp.]|uniref:class I SAM-dependent methyltransferase n=1 Tax=Fulvivirga sp. TaxID=1931237 RepID=UPI0032EAB50E
MSKKEWFGEWFDSPYYHVLYKHRDHEEAQAFIDNLTDYLDVSKSHKILDLACGKGRHSIYLNKKGFDVVGVDLSAQNIEYAKRYENDRLHFDIHDMREPFAHEEYDFILNLFTSFGYFDTKEEHLRAIKSVADSLKPGGIFILDFLNPYTVVHHLKPNETKRIGEIEFNISKHLSADDYIIKDIEFNDGGKQYHFQEKVKALRRKDFLAFFLKAGLTIEHVFGDYELSPYLAEESDRMIFHLRK